MANQEQLFVLGQGVETWNQWRNNNFAIKIDLREANLRQVNLSGADLSVADFRRANLSGATLSGADLTEANLSLINLSEANLSGANLSKANLLGANLIDANLSGANLSEANLSRADLTEANLIDANLSGANLREANLFEANLFGAKLIKAELIDTDLAGANLTGANLSEANLCFADLGTANLSGSNLTKAYLLLVRFNGANLTGANLTEAKLNGAILIGTDLTKARLHKAVLELSNLAYAKLVGADLTNANLIDANLAGADLTGAILNKAKLNGTILSKNINIVDLHKSWIIPLRAIQTNFIQRLQSGHLLNCETAGQYSELSLISGEQLEKLRAFCWKIAEKYKQVPENVKNVFDNHYKAKLGEEVVKYRLAECVNEVDYEQRIKGDGKVDFTLTSNPSIGLQVKTSYGDFNKIEWQISSEEIAKNAILVCVLSQESFDSFRNEYKLIMAGFLPTSMIQVNNGKALIGINELLYAGGLRSYLKSISCG